MPPRKTTKRGRDDQYDSSIEQEESSEVQSEDELERHARATPQDEDNDDDGDEEEDVEEEPERRSRNRQKGLSQAEKKKWRRLAIEEKESLVNEGGLVWKAAQPMMAKLSAKGKKDLSSLLTSALRRAEVKLNETLVPPTVKMPHASRNVGLGAGMASASYGSITGSVMSWQVERGDRLGEGEAEDRDEVALLELGGFSSDIAVLESLLLPEAMETVSMTQAIDEQERELETSKKQLLLLKADRESRKEEGEEAASELHSRLKRAKLVLDNAGSPPLSHSEALAIRQAAAAMTFPS
ncbi:hypothetical protein CBS101457_001600 [Exobasidium rhododendri]|nr:hypothetical protein CBS101457_001600 [Exobasidium rhododendri]